MYRLIRTTTLYTGSPHKFLKVFVTNCCKLQPVSEGGAYTFVVFLLAMPLSDVTALTLPK